MIGGGQEMNVSLIFYFYAFIFAEHNISNLISTFIVADNTLRPEDYYPHCFVLDLQSSLSLI